MHPQVIALLLFDGVIASEKIANDHGLDGKEKALFIQKMQNAIAQKNLPAITQEITNIPQNSQSAKTNSIRKTTNRLIDIDLKFNNSTNEVNVANETSDFDKILAPSAIMAYNIIQFARNADSRKDPDKQLALGAKLMDKSYSALHEPLISELSLATGASIATVLNIGLNIIKEYQYRKNEALVKNEFKEVIQKAEEASFNLFQALAHIKNYYEAQLSGFKIQNPADAASYQNKIEEWLIADRYIHTQLEVQQQKIASAGMMCQETQSKRRYERVVDVFETVLPAISLAVPPLMAGNLIIKAISKVGGMISDSMIHESAELNHAVVNAMNSLLITDSDSIQQAEKQLTQLINPSLALSGPILKTRTIVGVNIDRLLKTDKALARSLVENLGTRCSCSFSLSKPIPDIPLIEPALPGHHFGNDPELKKTGKQQLEQLIEAEKDLSDEIALLEWIGIELMGAHQPWPYVNNLEELTQCLTDAYQAIANQKKEIQKQFGDDYAKNPNSEGVKMLARSEIHSTFIEDNLVKLKTLQGMLKKTPHSVLYNNGNPIYSPETNEEQREQIVDTYASNEKARRMVLTDIAFNLDALDSIITHCETLGKGRHIQNLATSISELDAKLFLLDRAHQQAAQKTNKVSVDDHATLDSCKKRIVKLSERGALLDRERIKYIANEGNQERSEREKYQEYMEIDKNLVTYHENLPDNYVLTLPQHITNSSGTSIFQQLDDLKSDMELPLELELRTPSAIDLDQLSKTDRIIAPNRAHFGFYKNDTMDEDIKNKLDELHDKDSITTIQIMPRGISEALLAKCQGRSSHLQKAIEGLKTEMQWVSKFQQACDNSQITIANTDNLIQHYADQIKCLEAVCHNKSQRQERTSTDRLSAGSDNTHHELNHAVEKELDKAKVALETIKKIPAASASNDTQRYRDRIVSMQTTKPALISPLDTQASQTPQKHDI